MHFLVSMFSDAFRDSANMMLALLVFLATGTIAFMVMTTIRVRGAVKRRTERIVMDDSERAENSKRSLRYSSLQAVTQWSFLAWNGVGLLVYFLYARRAAASG